VQGGSVCLVFYRTLVGYASDDCRGESRCNIRRPRAARGGQVRFAQVPLAFRLLVLLFIYLLLGRVLGSRQLERPL